MTNILINAVDSQNMALNGVIGEAVCHIQRSPSLTLVYIYIILMSASSVGEEVDVAASLQE